MNGQLDGPKIRHGSYTDKLFIYSFFNDAFSSSDYRALNEMMIANNELGMMWKEAVVT
jgi:hypothetical protein